MRTLRTARAIALLALLATIAGCSAHPAGTTVSWQPGSGVASGSASASVTAPANVGESASGGSPSASPHASGNGVAIDLNAHSIDDPNSIWVVVNKRRAFDPRSYAPSDLVKPDVTNILGQPLRAPAAKALATMTAAAKRAGAGILLRSGYRSYSTQVSLYGNYVAADGKAAADRYSARPGFSEHQTGLAMDFQDSKRSCAKSACFATTASGTWLVAHAYQYGFILRFPQGKESVTGYIYEPWHYRYVGVRLAAFMHDSGITTLEEVFGLRAAPTYAD